MKLTIEKSALLPILAACMGTVDKKSSIPILSHVLLSTTADGLTVSGTNNYIQSTASAPADVSEQGCVAVTASDLIERVKALPAGPVNIAVNGQEATISGTGKRQFKSYVIPGGDFPKLPAPTEVDPQVTIPVPQLSELIERTYYAMCPDFTRSHVHAINMVFAAGKLTLCATDGHRGARASDEVAADDREALVPFDAIMVLRSLLARAIGDVVITFGKTMAFFDIGTVRLGTKLVDAQFPSFGQVVPKSNKHSARVSRAALLEAASAVCVAADEKKNGGIQFKMTADTIALKAESAGKGNATDEVACELTGGPVTFHCSAALFNAALSSLDCDNVLVETNGELDPIVIRPPADDSVLALLMPLRV
jgi:DNA polymerase-3 subunit beta